MRTARRGWFSALVGALLRRRAQPPRRRGQARMSRLRKPAVRGASMPTPPSYREQSPEVAARFARLKQRPVVLEVQRPVDRRFTREDGRRRPRSTTSSFELHRREFTCVIGPSGCGKSTLVRILVAGLEEPTRGEMLLDGKPVHGPGPDRGMVFQGYTLFPWLP